jgi:hypothetical protein
VPFGVPMWAARYQAAPRPDRRSPCPESVLTTPESMLTMAGIDAHNPGIGAQLRPEIVLTLLRNPCSPWSGIRMWYGQEGFRRK